MMNSFREPPPIEELSEISWKRVEHGLVDALDSEQAQAAAPAPVRSALRFRTVAVGFVAVAAVVLLMLAIRNDGSEKSSSLAKNTSQTATSQTATSQTATSQTATSQTATSKTATSTITTQESPTKVVLSGAHIEVLPHASVAVEQDGENLAFQLHEGGIRLGIEARDHTSPVVVTAGDVRIEVVGTRFAVYRSMGKTQVIVDEGIVAVSRGDLRELVRAGEQWPAIEEPAAATTADIDAGQPVVAPTASKEPKVEPRVLFEQAAAKEQSAPTEALHLYRRAARASGPWAANALFAQARLLLAQGQSSKAKRVLQRYLNRFPSGPNAADSKSLLKGLK